MTIDVVLYRDRTKLGSVSWGPTAEEACECYGKADNVQASIHGNKSRDPLRPFGDTPTGVYRGHPVASAGQDQGTLRKYGPHGYISLDPISGDALQAKNNGRFGLLIHGGDPSTKGQLRPTFGCIRLANDDMERLMTAVGGSAGTLTCEVQQI